MSIVRWNCGGFLVTYDNRVGGALGHLVRPPTSTGHLSRWRVEQLDKNEEERVTES